MGDKKKLPDPITKVPDPPQKEASPPAGAPATGPVRTEPAPSPLSGATPIDLSQTPASPLGKERDGPGGDGGLPRLSITKTGISPAVLGGTLVQPDWAAIRRTYTDHGRTFGGREMDEAQRNFDASLSWLAPLRLPGDITGKIANFGLAYAYDSQLSRENPTQLDRFRAESERALGPGKSLNEHILTVDSDSLSAGVKAITGKKIDFRF